MAPAGTGAMTRSRVAWSLAVVDMLAFIVVVLVDPAPDYGAFVLYILGIGAYVGIGALLVRRVPANPIGSLMLATGTLAVAAAVRPSSTGLWIRATSRNRTYPTTP